VPRPIRRIEIFIPLDYSDGRPIEESKFNRLENELLDRFGGVTTIQRRFPLRGLWKFQSDVHYDRVVVITVMDFHTQTEFESIQYLERLKGRLKKKFAQLEILIIVHELLAI
jgi:hypothetical protein